MHRKKLQYIKTVSSSDSNQNYAEINKDKRSRLQTAFQSLNLFSP